MRLTAFADYSLRTLIYVGAKGDDLSTIDDIANAYGISRNHLMKVVHRLAQLGYIDTMRGRDGGMRLARDPAEINIGALIRDVEESLALVECLQGKPGQCCIEPACALKGIFSDALGAFLGVLDRYTLADLLKPRRRLKTLLAMTA
jgi:Rrf2 family nitric oxide-sensitive transcriptional repressor